MLLRAGPARADMRCEPRDDLIWELNSELIRLTIPTPAAALPGLVPAAAVTAVELDLAVEPVDDAVLAGAVVEEAPVLTWGIIAHISIR